MLPALLALSTALYVALAAGTAVTATLGTRRTSVTPAGALPRLSILVAARNEAAALPRCLDALAQQRGLPPGTEFLIANDGSSDGTPGVIDAFVRRDARFRRVDVPEATGALRGKAHALHQAYLHATGEILLTTDADCTPPPDWARNLAAAFDRPDVGAVCGVTLVEHEATLERVQALDWLLGLTAAAAAARAGRPLTAMGNNMAFRRAAYEAVGGYPGLPASVTEDCMLFLAVHRTATWRVRLPLEARLGNRTTPLSSLRAIFRQRKRWARGGLHAAPWAGLLYLFLFIVHALLVAGLVVAPAVAVPLLLAKAAADVLILTAGGRRMATRLPWSTLPLFELYLFGYVLLLPFALLLAPRIAWKGRRY